MNVPPPHTFYFKTSWQTLAPGSLQNLFEVAILHQVVLAELCRTSEMNLDDPNFYY